MCQRRNQRFSDMSHGATTQLKTLQRKSKNFIKDTCNRKQITKRYSKRIRNLLQKRVLKKRRSFYQTFLVRNAKRTTKTFFDTIKS